MAHKKMTLKFDMNNNNKLYSRFFSTIRSKDFGFSKLDFVDIVLKDKKVGLAHIIDIKQAYFHEIDHVIIQQDTGMNYAQSLEFYLVNGIDIKNFKTIVDIIYLEFISYAPKAAATP